MESLLNRYLHLNNGSNEIPENVYRVCDLTGSHFYIKRSDYNTFCKAWIPLQDKVCLSMQLYSTPCHALYFDIDLKDQKYVFKENEFNDFLNTLESNLKMQFFPAIHDFTIIYAKRPHSKNIHVYLPEFTVAHDDYLELCQRLQSSLAFSDEGPFYLNAPIKWSFPGIGKPETHNQFYSPVVVKYITEQDTFTFSVSNFIPMKNKEQVDKTFKRIKKNNDSFFRKLLSLNSNQCQNYFYQLMMPIVVGFKQRYTISYKTIIVDTPNEGTFNEVAKVLFHYEDRTSYVLKGESLLLDHSDYRWLYTYLARQTLAIKNIDTDNEAIKSWFEMFSVTLENINEQSLFGKINLELRLDNPGFLKDPNPLKTIMEYDNGYFFLPVFFTLVKHLGLKAPDLVFHLRPMFTSPEIGSFLDRLENINPEYVQSISNKLTLNTLFFCSHNMRTLTKKVPKTFQEILIEIVENSKHLILGVTSLAKMSDLLLKIQEQHFPIKVIVQSSNTSTKSSTFIWNALKHSWKEINTEKERYDHISNLWTNVKNFITEYQNSGGTGGPGSDVIDKLNLYSITSTQSSNKSMEQETIEMDHHKWFLRLANGCMIDLLTGHVGAVVPEFYLSNRTINIDIPRPQLANYINESPTMLMKKLYNLLVDQKFFTCFLKQLLLDVTDDLYDTASLIVSKELLSLDWENDENAKSMLYFYVNLCKFVSFDYNVLMYMLDILASTMIAANYDRKFFVCKGKTNNGKSMLFEIIGRMLQQYFSSILSDNVQRGKSSSTMAPSPDLALTLFTCRVIAMEELESNFSENRIKQITGNSRVAFRSLFDTSKSAIPTAKVFATTNNAPECLVTQAFRERVVVLPFNSTFIEEAPIKTSEQVMRCLYPKIDGVVENAYRGSFFLLYFHLRNCVDPNDGLVHYRKQPKRVKIYTEEYLKNTDVYGKFKRHMDVQIIPNSMTTMTDLHSAIRDFMKDKKASADCETEIRIKFEQEFAEYRRTEKRITMSTYIDIFSTHDEPLRPTNKRLLNDSSDESEDETILAANSFNRKSSSFESDDKMDSEHTDDSDDKMDSEHTSDKSLKRKKSSSFENDLTPRKKQKTIETDKDQNVVVFYENVLIKNLKKTFTGSE